MRKSPFPVVDIPAVKTSDVPHVCGERYAPQHYVGLLEWVAAPTANYTYVLWSMCVTYREYFRARDGKLHYSSQERRTPGIVLDVKPRQESRTPEVQYWIFTESRQTFLSPSKTLCVKQPRWTAVKKSPRSCSVCRKDLGAESKQGIALCCDILGRR